MDRIRDEFSTQLGQILSTYREGMQTMPEHSESITNELLLIRSSIDNLIKENRRFNMSQDHLGLFSDAATSIDQMVGLESELHTDNLNAGQLSTSIEPALSMDYFVSPALLAFEHMIPGTLASSSADTTTMQLGLNYSENPNTAFSNCLQHQSNSKAIRKRKRMQDGLNAQAIAEERPALRDRLVASFRIPNPGSPSTAYRIYHGVGGFQSLSQLRTLLCKLRQHTGLECEWRTLQLPGIMRALDQIAEIHCTSAFLRRVLLVRLHHQRNVLLQDLARRETELHGNKLETLVLDELMCAAYATSAPAPPNHDKRQWRLQHADTRKRLTNHLTKARRWQSAVDAIGLGILALFPTGTDGEVRSYRFETLRDDHCQIILHELQTKCNGRVKMAASNLTPFVQATYDGQRYETELEIEKFGENELAEMDVGNLLILCVERSVEGTASTVPI